MFYYFSSLYERLSFLCRFNEFLLKFVLLCRFLENYKYTENMQGFYAILLLIVSNVFMTFAWYGHLKLQEMKWIDNWPLFGVILFSWSIALLEYCAQVPANRLGFIGNGGPFFPDAVKSGSRSNHTDHIHNLLHAFLQRRNFPMESFGCLCLFSVSGLLCVHEIIVE